jgi:hypothetical protein
MVSDALSLLGSSGKQAVGHLSDKQYSFRRPSDIIFTPSAVEQNVIDHQNSPTSATSTHVFLIFLSP